MAYSQHERSDEIDRDILLTSEVLIENDDLDISTVIKPMIDQVWNACGIEKSRNFKNSV